MSKLHDHAFSQEEYLRRRDAVERGLDAAGLDALAITDLAHIEYLTGYHVNALMTGPLVLIVKPGSTMHLVTRTYDESSSVRLSRVPLETRGYFSRLSAIQVLAESLASMGLERARLGLEKDLWGLAPRDTEQLASLLPHARLIDASRVVLSVEEIKSDEEIALLRRVMALTDQAMTAFGEHFRSGVSELELWNFVKARMQGQCYDMMVTPLFGKRTTLPNEPPSADSQLVPGDVGFIETGAFISGYAAGLCRTAVLGLNAAAEDLYRLAEDATTAAMHSMRPGVLTSEVDESVRKVLRRADRLGTLRCPSGYSHGIGWMRRGSLRLEPAGREQLQENMVFFITMILHDELGRFAVADGESVVVRFGGVERLSMLPRGLMRTQRS